MKNKFLILCLLMALPFMSCEKSDSNGSAASPDFSGGTTGKAGSMARFVIVGNRLYVAGSSDLRIFNISDGAKPVYENKIDLRGGVETIFAYGSKLFFGTTTGMDIYDISIPSSPVYLSTYSHIRSCDPVVVQNNYAYVTLRGGNECGSATNSLDIIDITDLQNPRMLRNQPMQSPYGLGLDGNLLFVCEGKNGFKTFGLINPTEPQQIGLNPSHEAYDLIAFNNILMVIGKSGLFQYSYKNDISNPDLKLLSKIPVEM